MSDAPQSTPKGIVARSLTSDDVGARGFLRWLQVSMPAAYKGILPDIKRLSTQARAQNVAGLGAFGESGVTTLFDMGGNETTVPASSAPASSSWSDSIMKALQAWGQYKLTDAQLDLAKQIATTNLQRAQLGQAPIPYDASQLGLAPTVNVGLSGDTGTLLKWALIGGAALFGLKMLGNRR